MKTIISSFAVLALIASNLPAEVEVVREVDEGQKMGKTKLLKEAPMEIYIGQFAVWYLASRADRVEHGEASIAARSEFDLSEEVAFAATNRARAYLQEQLESKGYVVKTHTLEEIENTKTYKKYLKKGGGTAANLGGTYYARNESRHNERIGTFADGVTSIYLGSHAQAGHYGKLAHEIAGKEGRLTLNIVTHLDYSLSEKKGYSRAGTDYVELKFVPHLRLLDDINAYLGQSTFNFHNNKKVGTRIFASQELVYKGEEWLGEHVLGEDEITYFKMDPAGFEEAAFELLKTYMDQLVARVVQAKAKG